MPSKSAAGAAARFRELDIAGVRLFATSSQAFAILVAGSAIGFGAQLGTVRLIGGDSFGTYAYVIAWATTVLGYISTLGFHVSLLRLLPTYRVGEDWPRASGVMRFALRAGAGAGVTVGGDGRRCGDVVHGDGSELARALLIGAAIVPLMALRLIGAAAVRAFGGVIASMVPERILRRFSCAGLPRGRRARWPGAAGRRDRGGRDGRGRDRRPRLHPPVSGGAAAGRARSAPSASPPAATGSARPSR